MIASMSSWPGARRLKWIAVLTAVAGAAVAVSAQRGFRGGIPVEPNPPYDGRFTFVRLRYGPPVDYVSQRVSWSHDYPEGERHFMKILNEVSLLNPHMTESSILGFDEPEIFKYPISYMAEPGFLSLSDDEAKGFRDYLLKGGFVIFDDFSAERGGWEPFAAAMQRVIPGIRFFDLDVSHPIFHSFFEIKSLDIIPQYYDVGAPVFRGIFEDNDPGGRLLAIINFNTDISEFWEFSDTGFRPISESNEAYKLGVNYVMYGLSH